MKKNHITGFGFSEKDLKINAIHDYKYITESIVVRDAFGKGIILLPFQPYLENIISA